MSESKNVCNTCGGSGEIGFFQGESRFFITREECPACCGLGYILEDQESGDVAQGPDSKIQGKRHE
jgi:hypothetical protein